MGTVQTTASVDDLNKITGLQSSAGDIDGIIVEYKNRTNGIIPFVDSVAYTPSNWDMTHGGVVNGNTVTFNKGSSQTKITFPQSVVEGTKYLLIANIENLVALTQDVMNIAFYNYSQNVYTLDINTWDKNFLVIPFTATVTQNYAQMIIYGADNETESTPLISFDTSFIGFTEWTQELEDTWTSISNDTSINHASLQNIVSASCIKAKVAEKALDYTLPVTSFKTYGSLASREVGKFPTSITAYDSTTDTISSYSTFDGNTYNCGAEGNKTDKPYIRGWFGFDVKPENYATEAKDYIFILNGTITATNVSYMSFQSAVGNYNIFAEDIVDGVETQVKVMAEIAYTIGETDNRRYTYMQAIPKDNSINFVYDCSLTSFAVFEKVDGFTVDDYIEADKSGLIVPIHAPAGTATESYVNSSIKNRATLTSNDFTPDYDIEMFLSGEQSLNVGGGASNKDSNLKNTPSFIGGDDVYPNDLSTQSLRDAFFGTALVPIADSGATYPPTTASMVTVITLLENENSVDISKFGSEVMPFTWGVSGSSITTMVKGTDSYNIMIEAVTKGKEFTNKEGKVFAVRGMNWYQGEADSSKTQQEYHDLLAQLFIDVNTDVKAITGQAEDIQFFTYQTSPMVGAGLNNMNVGEAQVQVAGEYSNVHLAGAMYQFDYGTDEFHPLDRAVIGLQTGVAIKRIIYDNKQWVDFIPLSHNVITDGTNYYIHLKLNVPVKPARFDVSGDEWHNVNGKQPNYGFELLDGNGTEQQIAEPFITKGDTIVLTSATDPTGMTIRYAVNGHYGGGNVCDSQNIVIKNKNIDYVIDNFLVSFSAYVVS